MSRRSLIPLLCSACLVLAAGGVPGCRQDGGEDGAGDLAVVASPLSDETTVAFFVLGRDHDFQPVGTVGTLSPGPPRAAGTTFRGVAEGGHLVAFIGYATLGFAAPNPPSFPASGHCLRDHGETGISVVSGRPLRARIATVATSGCAHLALDRYVANPNYESDAGHPWFGSGGGDNVLTLYVDDWGGGAKIDVDVGAGGASSPFGLFATLPDTAGGQTWPPPASWGSSLTLTADANGDALCFLVVKPGSNAVVRDVVATNTDTTESVRIPVWVSGPSLECSPPDCDDGIVCTVDSCNQQTGTCEHAPDHASCDDGNPCTAGVCDPASGCTNPPVLAGTACGTGLICDDGACVPGARLGTLDDLTGDASNSGGALFNFPEMRCGNAEYIVSFEVEHFTAITFDLSALEAGATIATAKLHVNQLRVDGDNLYTGQMLEVVSEHVRFDTIFDADIVEAIAGTIGQRVVSTSGEPGWRSADITEAVLYEVAAARDRVQVRLRFVPSMTDGDGEIDLAIFASDNATDPATYPFLTVRYAP